MVVGKVDYVTRAVRNCIHSFDFFHFVHKMLFTLLVIKDTHIIKISMWVCLYRNKVLFKRRSEREKGRFKPEKDYIAQKKNPISPF